MRCGPDQDQRGSGGPSLSDPAHIGFAEGRRCRRSNRDHIASAASMDSLVRAGSTAASWATIAWTRAMPAVSDGKNVTPSAGTISTCSTAPARAGLAASVTANTRAPRLFASLAARTVLSYRRQKLTSDDVLV